MKSKIMGEVVFSGNMNPNPDGATEALIAAGFDVVRMPEHFHETAAVPGDEFLEASKVGDRNAIWEEIQEIVAPFNGDCDTCGEIDAYHRPFMYLRYSDN
jgi:hypothetical protein